MPAKGSRLIRGNPVLVEQLVRGKLAGKTNRQVAKSLGISDMAVSAIYNSPGGQAVAAKLRIQLKDRYALLLSRALDSMLAEFERADLKPEERKRLRSEALDMVWRGEPTAFLPQGMQPDGGPGGFSGSRGFAFTELAAFALRQSAPVTSPPAAGPVVEAAPVNGNGHNGYHNGHNGNGHNGNGHG